MLPFSNETLLLLLLTKLSIDNDNGNDCCCWLFMKMKIINHKKQHVARVRDIIVVLETKSIDRFSKFSTKTNYQMDWKLRIWEENENQSID